MSNSPEQTTAPVPEDAREPLASEETKKAVEHEAASAETAPEISAEAASPAVAADTEANRAETTAEEESSTDDTNEQTADDSEEFRRMLEESLSQQPTAASGELLRGTVVGVDREIVSIDVGGKDEGRISVQEFEQLGEPLPAIGDEIEVMVESSGGHGGSSFSVLAARRQAIWESISTSLDEQTILRGKVVREVKGGLRVQLGGIEAFMPRSESDTNPGRPVAGLVGQDIDVVVITATRRPENVVVSRKRPMLEVVQQQRAEFFASAKVGDKISGEVRRMADFGAFVDLGGIDALLHVSDIAWRRLKHPSEALQVGQQITAEITKMNEETGKVSVSMRSLQADPWENAAEKYNSGMRITGTVRRLLDFGAMVELEPGVEGMIHRSEMSWTRRDTDPAKLLSEGDVVDVAVLNVDADKRRIALSLKAVAENPWQAWLASHPAGSHVSGPIRSITDFGMFVGLSDDLDGMVHIGDLSWKERGDAVIGNYSKGEQVECAVLGVDVDKQRISLGIKQLESDPFEVFMAGAKRGGRVEGKVISIDKGAASVELIEGVVARLALREVPREDNELKVGDEVEAKITELDRKRRRIGLSISQFLRDEEKNAVRNYSQSLSSGENLSPLALELQRKLLSKQKETPAKNKPSGKTKTTKKPEKPVTAKKSTSKKLAAKTSGEEEKA